MAAMTWNQHQLAAALHVERGEVRRWIAARLLCPREGTGGIQGKASVFDTAALERGRVIKGLVRRGKTLAEVREIVGDAEGGTMGSEFERLSRELMMLKEKFERGILFGAPSAPAARDPLSGRARDSESFGEALVRLHGEHVAAMRLDGRKALGFAEWLANDRVADPAMHASYEAEMGDESSPEYARRQRIFALREDNAGTMRGDDKR